MSETKNRFLLITYQTEKSITSAILPVVLISYIVGILYLNLDTLLVLFPSGEGDYSFQLLEGIIMVSIAVGSGFLIVFALKKHLIIILKSFFALSFFLTSVCMFWVHGYLIEVTFRDNVFWVEIITAVIGGIIGCLAILSFIVGKGGINTKNTIIFTHRPVILHGDRLLLPVAFIRLFQQLLRLRRRLRPRQLLRPFYDGFFLQGFWSAPSGLHLLL